jgi:hypothetical protein
MTRVLKIVGIERLLKVFKNAKNPAFSTLYSLFAELTGKLRSFLGFFQQRYVKRHAVYHKPDIHNEIGLFAAPTIRPPSGR